MTSTLNPACPLCGLRYQSKPLLDVHIREDHRQQPGRRGSGGAGASPPPVGGDPGRYDPASGPSRTMKEVTAVTATQHPRGGQVIAIARRALRALRHVNDELLRACEAIIGSARAPQPRQAQQDRPRVQAPGRGDMYPGRAADRAGRAA
jgi:hypothetical protein